MALTHIRSIGQLDGDWTLAPERWDPRAVIPADGPLLHTFFRLVTHRVPARNIPDHALVLDCGHAVEGVVLTKQSRTPRRPKSTKTSLHAGDVIVSRLRPYLRQVALIDDALFHHPDNDASRPVLCSTEFYVLRQRDSDGPPPACIVPYLLSIPVQSALLAAQSGGHHPRVPKDVLMSLPWPFTTSAAAITQAEAVHTQVRAIRNGFRGLSALVY